MKDMLHKQLFCDVIIKVQDEEFRSHKSVLAARSSVFHEMLHEDMVEKGSDKFQITDCEPDAFREFLAYFYSGDMNELSTKRVCEVYCLADKYKMPQLKLDCITVMKKGMSVENFCEIIHFAVLHKESEVIKRGTDFFLKNIKDVLQSVQWQTFLKENPDLANDLFLKQIDGAEDKKSPQTANNHLYRQKK